MSAYINLLHILIIVPLLYILYNNRENIPKIVCKAIMGISVIGFIYHFILLKTLPDNKKYMDWVYLTHLLIVFPLLFYIGYNCTDTKRKYFEMLLLIIFAALGYHTYNYFKYR